MLSLELFATEPAFIPLNGPWHAYAALLFRVQRATLKRVWRHEGGASGGMPERRGYGHLERGPLSERKCGRMGRISLSQERGRYQRCGGASKWGAYRYAGRSIVGAARVALARLVRIIACNNLKVIDPFGQISLNHICNER